MATPAKAGQQVGASRGDRYRCVNPQCLCEIKVAREPFVGASKNPHLRCCCGSPMEKIAW